MTKINYSEVLTKCVFKMYIWLKLRTSQLYKCIKREMHKKGNAQKKEIYIKENTLKKGNVPKEKYI